MAAFPLILSTKVLTPSQKRHVFHSNLKLVEYNAVKIEPLDVDLSRHDYNNAIFTSQNAVKLMLKRQIKIKNVFCVGDKTSALLRHSGFKIIENASNALELSHRIAEYYKGRHFDFFCSKQRRNELPTVLKNHNISLKEYHVYDSISSNYKFDSLFNAVLCFSPLGVKSYYEHHEFKPKAICIGKTTATAAGKYTNDVFTSSKPTVESVVIKAIKVLSEQNRV